MCKPISGQDNNYLFFYELFRWNKASNDSASR